MPSQQAGHNKTDKRSVIWVKTVKSWHKIAIRSSLTEQPNSFQISIGTSAPTVEITRAEVKAMTHSLSVLRLGEYKGERGLSTPPCEDRPVSRCFYSVMALVVLEDDFMKYLP